MFTSIFQINAGLSCGPIQSGGQTLGELHFCSLKEAEERGGGARKVALPQSGFAMTCIGHHAGHWVLVAGQDTPFPFSGMCTAPSPTPGGPGATWSAILMLSAGPGCCKHPYATLLQGLRVANNRGHLLVWHRAQAQRPGNRARQRLVLRRAP